MSVEPALFLAVATTLNGVEDPEILDAYTWSIVRDARNAFPHVMNLPVLITHRVGMLSRNYTGLKKERFTSMRELSPKRLTWHSICIRDGAEPAFSFIPAHTKIPEYFLNLVQSQKFTPLILVTQKSDHQALTDEITAVGFKVVETKLPLNQWHRSYHPFLST